MPPRDPYDLEQLIKKIAEHSLTDSVKAETWRKEKVLTTAELEKKIAEVLNHPDTSVFRGLPQLNRGHPVLGEQFGRETYVLEKHNPERNRTENIVIVLNANVRDGEPIGGSAWVTPQNALPRLVRQEVTKTGREQQDVEIIKGGRPALLELDSRRLPVEIQPQQCTETLLERIERERKERGDVALREVGKDRSLEQKREQERGR